MLYQRIRNLREDKDLTQKRMDETLFCSQCVYGNYEKGKLDIPTEILIELTDFYGVSADYVLNRTDENKSYYSFKGRPCRAALTV